MEVYLEVSDWKGKSSRLVEALRRIRDNPKMGRQIATEALQEFERNK